MNVSETEESAATSRSKVISAVRGPLGFFVLAISVLDGLAISLVWRAQGQTLSVSLFAVLAVMSLLIAGMLYVVVKHPGAFSAHAQRASTDLRDAQSETRAAEHRAEALRRGLEESQRELETSRATNQLLQSRLDDIASLRHRVIAVLHRSDAVSDAEIFRQLEADSKPHLKAEIQAVLGILISEGKASRATLGGYYKAQG
jgi:hypothetical protein